MIRKNKYNVAPPEQRTWNGRLYDSKAEMLYARRLGLLMAEGSVVSVIEQPKVWLGLPENSYKPDFFVVAADGERYFVDVKGKTTAKFNHNKRLWKKYGPGWGNEPLLVVRRSGERFRVDERIEVEGTKETTE